jgi:hypothetical protein
MRFLIKRWEMFCDVTLCRRAPERKHTTPWPVFIRTHLALLAGTDFFTVEVLDAARTGDLLRAVLHPS